MDANLLTRFETALAGNQLDALVEAMKAEGYAQGEVFDEFDQFRQRLAGREADEDNVLEMMDRIWGWCAPDQRLFSDSLTEEKIQAQRQQLRKRTARRPSPL